jgi:hypothetical protein
MAARGLIERRDAYQAVHARFAGEQAVSIFAAELNRGVFDTGLLAGCFVEQVGGDAVALGPAEIHSQEDRGPVLRFGAAGAGLDGHDGVEVVVLAGEQGLGFEFTDVGIRASEFLAEILQQFLFLFGVGFAFGEFDVCLDVARERFQFLVRGKLIFDLFAVAEDALRFFLIAPEIGVGGAGFEGFQARAVLRSVKESSARE